MGAINKTVLFSILYWLRDIIYIDRPLSSNFFDAGITLIPHSHRSLSYKAQAVLIYRLVALSMSLQVEEVENITLNENKTSVVI